MSIEGEVVAVTGASSGIGRAAAKLLAGRGCAVVLGARRRAPLAAAVDDIAAAGGRAAFRVADVTRRSDLDALVALGVERFGRPDVIVTHAGIGPTSRSDALRVRTGTRCSTSTCAARFTASRRRSRSSRGRGAATSSTSCRPPA